MSQYLRHLQDIIAKHRGYQDYESCPDPAVRADIEALAAKIDDELLEEGVIAGMATTADLQEMMGYQSINAVLVRVHRDKDFPAAAVGQERLYPRRKVAEHLAAKAAEPRTKGGRPPKARP